METYTKEQAIGYMIITAKEVGLSEKDIKVLVAGMRINMNEWAETYAEQGYKTEREMKR